MSPGMYTIKHTQHLANKLKKKRLQQAQRSTKRRRLELKIQRSAKDASQSVLEADTYDGNIGLDNNPDLEDIAIDHPDPFSTSKPFLVFDLETTGFARTSDITQIAAICGNKTFNRYIRPDAEISLEATKVTGISCVAGIMKHNGTVVESSDPGAGLQAFIDFINSFESKPVILGHNIQSYDIPVLMHQLTKFRLFEDFKSSISGFIDTLKVSKRAFSKSDTGNFKQETLVKTFLGKQYEAHNALADVSALQELFEAKLLPLCGTNDVFTFDYYAIKSSLEPLVKAKAISTVTSKKLIESFLSLPRLQIIHKRDPDNGIRNVFSEPLSGNLSKPRISKCTNVITKVIDYLNKC